MKIREYLQEATKPKKTSGFECKECGHKFKTAKAAEKASTGDKGCPKCGGSDIDY
jgi:predicted Zn-ribbon and HTH transcriptional regulator